MTYAMTVGFDTAGCGSFTIQGAAVKADYDASNIVARITRIAVDFDNG